MTDLAHPGTPNARVGAGLLDVRMLVTRLPAACAKLDPRMMTRNPVMFVVEVGAALSTVLAVVNPSAFAWMVVVWLWATVIFANLAEAVAEGRGKAQAASLRRSRQETTARLLVDGVERPTPAAALKVDDRVVCEVGDVIPDYGGRHETFQVAEIRRPSALGVHSCDAGEANRQQWKWIKRHCFLDYRACGWDAAECHAVSVVLLRGDYRIHFNGHGLGINGSGDGHPMARELFRRLLIA